VETFSFLGLGWLQQFNSTYYEPADDLSARQDSIIQHALGGRSTYMSLSPSLGWTVRPYGMTSLYRSNGAGVRIDREYSEGRGGTKTRIATFGDSYTHCDEVSNGETWQSFLSERDTSLEVLNYGVGGYGLDQAYLRYLEEGERFTPRIVIIGFMSANIYRNVNVFRPFHRPGSQIPFSKPRFILDNGQLQLVPNPLRNPEDYAALRRDPRTVLAELGRTDHFYADQYSSSFLDVSPTVRLAKIMLSAANGYFRDDIVVDGVYNEDSEAFAVTKRLFDEWVERCTEKDEIPVILIFPNEHDLRRYRDQGDVQYAPLLSYFESKKYRYIDLAQGFQSLGNTIPVDDLFLTVHYSAKANRLVAEALHDYLKALQVCCN